MTPKTAMRIMPYSGSVDSVFGSVISGVSKTSEKMMSWRQYRVDLPC